MFVMIPKMEAGHQRGQSAELICSRIMRVRETFGMSVCEISPEIEELNRRQDRGYGPHDNRVDITCTQQDVGEGETDENKHLPPPKIGQEEFQIPRPKIAGVSGIEVRVFIGP